MQVLPPLPPTHTLLPSLNVSVVDWVEFEFEEIAHQKSFQSTNQLLIFMSLILTFSKVQVLFSHTSPQATSVQ